MSLLNVAKGLTVVGRGVGSAVAAEISLKIREVSGVRSEAYAASDFAHGPIGAEVVSTETKAMIEEGRGLSKIHKNVVVKLPLIGCL